MRRLLRRLISRLHAERDRARRRRLGAAGEAWSFLALELSSERPYRARAPAVQGDTIDFAAADDLLRRPAAYWLDRDGAEAIVRGGDRCLVVRRGGEVLYRAIVMTDVARVAALLDARGGAIPAAVVSGVLVHPEHRGRRVHAAAMAWLADALRAEGIERIVAWVALWNRSSLRAFERAGFRHLSAPPTPPRR